MSLRRLWPRSLQAQLLLAIALALLLAQAIGAALIWREQAERREMALIHAAAIRIASDDSGATGARESMHRHHRPAALAVAGRLRLERLRTSPLHPGERRAARAEGELRAILEDQGLDLGEVVVVYRPIGSDAEMARRSRLHHGKTGRRSPPDARFFLAAVERRPAGDWLAVRIPAPPPQGRMIASLIGQTLLIYALLVGAIAVIVGRITRPLAQLAGRVDHFAQTRDTAGQLAPQGPSDVRRLIEAHNTMENRIAALIDEKDVMLGAIGHDLKTPLAALRVRIEGVSDPAERARMAATIEDISRTLDDILSLARVGRPSDPLETVELSALIAQLAEEYEDMGDPVCFAAGERVSLQARATWLRRAIRNLVGNALRYGGTARIVLSREHGEAVIRIEDDGPGIAEDEIEHMLEPFTRGEPSRNSATGGAGLGLTLARAIAQQHGGRLELANRRDNSGAVTGLTASLVLPT